MLLKSEMLVALVLILPSLVFFSSAQCPAGQGTNYGGSCADCPMGKYQELNDATVPCKDCPNGKYTLQNDVDKLFWQRRNRNEFVIFIV